MFQTFYQHCKRKNYWQAGERILLAVSGGVDSMVLLDLMQKVAVLDHVQLTVAHINHRLRKESEEEAAYIENYCNQKRIPYFCKEWTDLAKQTNTEAKAREFRYAFFAEVMEAANATILMTAHHSDDQAETVLMKLLRGSSLSSLAGIKDTRPFAKGQLLRPFLIFSKEELETFAKKEKIVYFEDRTNSSKDYQRNRLRQQVMPILKQENPQVLQHIQEISEQIHSAEVCLEQLLQPKYYQWVTPIKTGWQLTLAELAMESQSVQTFFLNYFFQQTLLPLGVRLNKAQIKQMLAIIASDTPQQEITLAAGWCFQKEYQMVYVIKTQAAKIKAAIKLDVGEQIFLSEGEWLALESNTEPVQSPENTAGWQQQTIDLSDRLCLPLTIRHRQAGDRIALTNALTKRVSRVFIDQKIPNSQRDQAWLILTSDEKVLWIPKYANSYLSIPKETDKILYRLIYKTSH